MARSLSARLRALFRDPNYRPLNKSELARELGVGPKERAELRESLRRLEASGDIMRIRKARYLPRAKSDNVLVGTLRFQRSGNAWLVPDDDPRNAAALRKLGEADRLFVHRRGTITALEGDRVAVKLHEGGAPQWWRHVKTKRALLEDAGRSGDLRIEGKVVRILERAESRVVGTFRKRGKFTSVEPGDATLPPSIHIPAGKGKAAREGDVVVVSIDRWDARDQMPEGHVIERLGRAGAPGVDILAIIHRARLPLEFPKRALAEADEISDAVPESACAGRDDWRGRFVLTIDPFDARDFDDAISVVEDERGWELAVHIADVSHYVAPGSALDAEARERGNSVYLVDRVIPMLPEKLSNGICSLKPNVDRLTRAVIMRFDRKGTMGRVEFTSAVIRSRVRLTYEEAYAKLQADPARADDGGVTEMLHTAWRLASVLRKNRFYTGSLDLDFPEIKVILDEKGTPIELRRVEYDESHQLIEEFMLAANEAVARRIQHADRPSIYRVHDDPDAGKLFEFRELVRLHGIDAGDLADRHELQRVLKLIRGMPEEHALKISLLKSLKRAVYSPIPLGHYGLAKTHYTHFTSPIRRYADLIVHRVLDRIVRSDQKNADPRQLPSFAEMQEIAEHISATERTAADAESESRRLKELEYLDNLARSPSPPTFTAVVMEAHPLGLFVELEDIFIRGLIRRDDLPAGDFFFDAARQQYAARSGPKQQFRVGDEIQVAVSRVDFDTMRVDFRAV